MANVKSNVKRKQRKRQPKQLAKVVNKRRKPRAAAGPSGHPHVDAVSRLLAKSISAQPDGIRLANPGGRHSQRQAHVDRIVVTTDSTGCAIVLMRPGVFRGTYVIGSQNALTGAYVPIQRNNDSALFVDSNLQPFVDSSELYCSTGFAYEFVPNIAATQAPGFGCVETIASVSKNGAPRSLSNLQLINFDFAGTSQASLATSIRGIVPPAGPDAIRFHSSRFYPLFTYGSGPHSGQPIADQYTDRPDLPFGPGSAGSADLDPHLTENRGERLKNFINSLGYRSGVEGWDVVVFYVDGAAPDTDIGVLQVSRAVELIGFGSSAPDHAFAVDPTAARLDVGTPYDNGELGTKLADAVARAAPTPRVPGARVGIIKPENAEDVFDAIAQTASEHMSDLATRPQYQPPPRPGTAEHRSLAESLVSDSQMGSLVRYGAESVLPGWAGRLIESTGAGAAIETGVDYAAGKAFTWATDKISSGIKSLFHW